MPRLHVISASVRRTSRGRSVARWATGLARASTGFDAGLVDLRDVALPFLDEEEHPSTGRYVHRHTREWSATIAAADAFVFVMPMHNGGFSAPLKNAVDHLQREWAGKPVGLISYSAGASGGAPAIEMLRPVLKRVDLRPVATTLSLRFIDEHVGEDGRFRPAPEQTGALAGMLGELAVSLTASARDLAS
ncbi:hypothetical protein GCM10009527_087300 [Actinomadura nitritigenes]|uniref:NAD(P)H-dependent oxidoreductase n=1 Tax=Actinomadura nitritigenes TaxID=134602 RepID=A0ABS3R644_9ACTN|nr:NAD(P)H-dependent oxidoreductase [Actinomadura nitritigenes]MBO2441512.1 NAD(P)H-dependent oxidoreductase [Actinomadura nitritigenes]